MRARLMALVLGAPSLHFLVIGAVLFAASAAVQSEDEPPPIRVTTSRIDALAAGYLDQHGRAPSEAELRGLIDDWIEDEVLYREALALGLDRSDPIVRRRLIQAMRFVTEPRFRRPSEEQVRSHYRQQAERYRRDERYTAAHVFLGRDGSAASALAELRAGARPSRLGRPFVHGSRIAGQSRAAVARLYGERFAKELAGGPIGEWFGPVPSSYGQHLVRIDQRSPAGTLPLEAVRRRVESEVVIEERERAQRDRIRALRRRYQVELEERP